MLANLSTDKLPCPAAQRISSVSVNRDEMVVRKMTLSVDKVPALRSPRNLRQYPRSGYCKHDNLVS